MASPETTEITLEPLEGGRPLRLTWEHGAAEALARGDRVAPARSPWQVEGPVDWERAEELRLVSAVFDDGRALAVAAMRPRGATGHDADSVAHHLVDAGQQVELTQTLLSVEYDADGLPRRLGLELWDDAESPPVRVAADRQGGVEVGDDAGRRELARMAFRLDGTSGAGVYEVLRPH
jgi:hypothetical protein